MPTTKSGVVYALRNPDGQSLYSEHWVQGANQVTTEVQLDWASWDVFVNDMLGYSGWLGANLSRSLPEPNPDYPYLIPVDIQLKEVIGIPVNGADFDFSGDGIVDTGGALAVAAVTWHSVLYNATVTDDQMATLIAGGGGEWLRYVEVEKQWTIENMAVVGTHFRWHDTQAAFVDPSGKGAVQRRYKFGTITYHWHQVPSVLDPTTQEFNLPQKLLDNWTATEGNVNIAKWDGYDPGTLLCGAVEFVKTISAVGKVQFEVKIPLSYYANGWNNKYRPCGPDGNPPDGFFRVDGVFYPPTPAGFVGPLPPVIFDPYPQVDFTKLFQNA